MAGGSLDVIVARIEAYIGEFLQTRNALLDAKGKIERALDQAAGTGSAQIGEKTFTIAQLQSLMTENTGLLARNADLQTQIADFRDKVAAVSENIDASSEALYDFGPGLLYGGGAMGAIPLVVPAGVLVATGAILATGLYLFIGSVRTHVGAVAGNVGSNLVIYGGIALLGVWYAKKQRWI